MSYDATPQAGADAVIARAKDSGLWPSEAGPPERLAFAGLATARDCAAGMGRTRLRALLARAAHPDDRARLLALIAWCEAGE